MFFVTADYTQLIFDSSMDYDHITFLITVSLYTTFTYGITSLYHITFFKCLCTMQRVSFSSLSLCPLHINLIMYYNGHDQPNEIMIIIIVKYI